MPLPDQWPSLSGDGFQIGGTMIALVLSTPLLAMIGMIVLYHVENALVGSPVSRDDPMPRR